MAQGAVARRYAEAAFDLAKKSKTWIAGAATCGRRRASWAIRG